MQYSIKSALALIVGGTFRVNAQSNGDIAATDAAVPGTESHFLVVHQEADSRFVTSIERTGPCTLHGAPLETSQLRVPYQLYPRESADKHEEGTVKMQLIFDPAWCVRKATIVQSTKFWRLDEVSLKWAMTIKWSPKKTLFTPDGEPTVTFPIGWGASP